MSRATAKKRCFFVAFLCNVRKMREEKPKFANPIAKTFILCYNIRINGDNMNFIIKNYSKKEKAT